MIARLFFLVLIMGLVLSACGGVEMIPVPQGTAPVKHLPSPISQEATVMSPLPNASPGPDEPVSNTPGSATPGQNTNYEPQPSDARLTRGPVFIEETGILIRESYPPQISVQLSGNLPTPCNRLRVAVGEPDTQGVINLEAYTVSDPDMMCAQVLKPFEAAVSLGTYPDGKYRVQVNGQDVGEFSVP